MAKQKGEAKQVPADQRGRGLNPQHPEGKANIQNQKQPPAPPATAAPSKTSAK